MIPLQDKVNIFTSSFFVAPLRMYKLQSKCIVDKWVYFPPLKKNISMYDKNKITFFVEESLNNTFREILF